MIQKVEMYQAVCDGCGKTLKDKYGNTLHTYSSHLVAQISVSREWLFVNHSLYCPDCVEWDEETKSYKPKKKKQ